MNNTYGNVDFKRSAMRDLKREKKCNELGGLSEWKSWCDFCVQYPDRWDAFKILTTWQEKVHFWRKKHDQSNLDDVRVVCGTAA